MSAPLDLVEAKVTSPDLHDVLHISVQTQLSQVIHATTIQVALFSLEQGESSATIDFRDPMLTFEMGDFCGFMDFTLLHTDTWLERVT